MPALINAVPLTPTLADKWWVKHLSVVGSLATLRLIAYDGTYTVGTETDVQLELSDGVKTALSTEVARLSGRNDALKRFCIIARDPAKPVVMIAMFDAKPNYVVRDLFALYAADATFAGVYEQIITYIGGQL